MSDKGYCVQEKSGQKYCVINKRKYKLVSVSSSNGEYYDLYEFTKFDSNGRSNLIKKIGTTTDPKNANISAHEYLDVEITNESGETCLIYHNGFDTLPTGQSKVLKILAYTSVKINNNVIMDANFDDEDGELVIYLASNPNREIIGQETSGDVDFSFVVVPPGQGE